MLRLLWIAVVAAVFGLPSSAWADGLVSELKIGALYHDVPGLWSGFQVERQAVDINAEIDFHPLWSSESSSILPAIGGTYNPDGQTSHGYADVRWKITPSPIWYLTFGIGAAFNNGQTDLVDYSRKALGSHILFHPSVELGLNLDAHNNVSVYFEHMSNGNLATYNEGMDDIGVRYGYRF